MNPGPAAMVENYILNIYIIQLKRKAVQLIAIPFVFPFLLSPIPIMVWPLVLGKNFSPHADVKPLRATVYISARES